MVAGPGHPLHAVAGKDLILPCYLKDNISAKDMTVKWLRLDHPEGSLVHQYNNRRDWNDLQIQSYKGRTSLFKEEFKKGNVSLRLTGVQISDEGDYKCMVVSDTHYHGVLVKVHVRGKVCFHLCYLTIELASQVQEVVFPVIFAIENQAKCKSQYLKHTM